ncbi:phage minor tail protein L [Shigella boydii]|nr:phage minor tail protein L [Shigella boydii]
MAEPVGDLVVDLSLDAARFDEQMARVRRHFSGTESDAKKTAAVVEQSLSRQALAAQKAGISVGQYKAAMRMLPAQFTDVATQLAGGQSPWLILLQQGGQVKDSFGGMIPMFRGLAGAITLPMVGATSLAVAIGALAYAWYQGDSTLSSFNKTLVLSGNQAGLTADRMLVLSRAGQAAGLTFNQTSESLTALVNAGVRGGEQFEAISQSVARFSSASGVEVDKVAEAFGKLTTDPTSGLTAMARQFHNVTAEQIAYVAQLQRSGDEAGALQAANEAATKGFDDLTRRLKENMGTLETWADRTARAFKSMWDSVLDIGRPDTAREMLEKAEKAFDEADKKWQWYQSRSHRRGKTSAFLANLRGAWEDRANAQLGLSAGTLQADLEKAREMAAKDWAESEASRLKYTEEAQKAYERLQTPLEKYTARQEELNKALKDGKILQADYNTLMAAAKKDYEATLKKPKQFDVKVSAGDRQEDSAHAALLTLQAELRTLEKHAGANEKISQQRRDLWKAESQFAVLEEAAQRRQLSAQEKSLLAHKDETLEYKHQLAALGDKGTSTRPTLTVSNLYGMVTGMAEDLQSLVGGTVVRRKVYARFLDAVNFVNGNSDADPEQEVISRWRIEQCSELSAVSASFVLSTPTETDGAVFPGRIMLANTCTWTYRGDECGYHGPAVADEYDQPTSDITKDKCSKCLSGCKFRNNVGNFGGFLSINKLSQ